MDALTAEIWSFECHCEQEEHDRAEMLRRLLAGEDLLGRDNASAHFTASAWIANRTLDRVLLCYHQLYDSWSWLGGHADGDSDLMRVALREAREESGLTSLTVVGKRPLSLEILCVLGHLKHGAYVSSHLHLNLTYLMVADDEEPLRVRVGENTALRWFSPQDAIAASSEPWFQRWIYPKLNERMTRFGNEL